MNSLTKLPDLDTDTESDVFAVDIAVLWYQFCKTWWIPFVVATLVTLASFMAARTLIEDSWEAKTILIRHNKNMSSQADIPYLYLQIDFNTVLETILVRENLESVIDRLQLDITPEALYKHIEVKRGNRSDVINIYASWDEPQMAVEVANTVSDVFIDSYASIQNASAKDIYQYFSKELKHSNEKLVTLEQRDFQFRKNNDVISIEAQIAMDYQKLREIDIKMIDSRVRASEITTKRQLTQQKLREVARQVPLETIVTSESYEHISSLRRQLHELKQRYTNENPKVKNLVKKIAAYEEQQKFRGKQAQHTQTVYGENPVYLQLELELISYELELMVSQTSLENYEAAIADIQSNLTRLNALNREYQRIVEEAEQQRATLSTLKSRMTEAKLALGSNISDFDVIEVATPPQHPKSSHRKLIAVGMGALSFIACVVVLAARVLLSKTIKTSFDVTRLLRCHCVGQIPCKGLVNEKQYYAALQLAFEDIESQRRRDNSKLIVVSSGDFHSDKAMLSSELAQFYALQQKRVLYIESTDNRDSMETARINNSLYHDSNNWQPLSVASHMDKAYFFCDKSIYVNYLDQAELGQRIDKLADDYDVVIWEMFKPHDHLQLYMTVSNVASAVLFVARSFFSKRSSIHSTIDYLKEKGVQNVGVVINQVPLPLLSH